MLDSISEDTPISNGCALGSTWKDSSEKENLWSLITKMKMMAQRKDAWEGAWGYGLRHLEEELPYTVLIHLPTET